MSEKSKMAIRYRLKSLIEEKEIREERSLPYRLISVEAGVSPNTITSIVRQRSKYIARTTLDKFCKYFDCQPGDIIVYIPNEQIDTKIKKEISS